jgi:predicted ArsR family transcriptional regulator
MRADDCLEPGSKILTHLKTRGPQTAFQIARKLGVTAMAVRQQLYRLNDQGLVEFVDERRKVGRPARIWKLSAEAAEHFPDNHRELTAGIIDAARAVFGDGGLEQMLSERTRRQLEAYRTRIPDNLPLERRVAALTALRSAQGYMAEWSRARDGSLQMVENHCPICVAAGKCPSICDEELSLFKKVLGADAGVERSEHILQGARRCAYRIIRHA